MVSPTSPVEPFSHLSPKVFDCAMTAPEKIKTFSVAIFKDFLLPEMAKGMVNAENWVRLSRSIGDFIQDLVSSPDESFEDDVLASMLD
eukprot:7582344-Pyramimonas_sp.AAC.1